MSSVSIAYVNLRRDEADRSDPVADALALIRGQLLAERDRCIAFACLVSWPAVGVAALDINLSFVGIAIAAWLARQAVVNQRRADAILPRSAACDAIEGADHMAEAA